MDSNELIFTKLENKRLRYNLLADIENNLTTLNGFNLKYSSKLGLMYEKEEEDG